MRPHQQENLRNASQTLGNVTLGSGGCRWWFHHSRINRNVVLLINRGLRKSGGKGKKYDKEAMRASLDSRYFRHLRHYVTVLSIVGYVCGYRHGCRAMTLILKSMVGY